MVSSVGSAVHGWWALLPVGVCAGVLSGTLGVGSGTLIIPALVLILGLPQKSAQGMCLAAMAPMVLVGAIRYKMNPEIEVNMLRAALLAAGGVAGAFIGVEIATRLPGSVLRKIFACFIIAVGLRMLLFSARPKTAEAGGPGTHDQASAQAETVAAAEKGETNDDGGD